MNVFPRAVARRRPRPGFRLQHHLIQAGLLPLLAACSGGASGPVDGKAALSHVERILALGPRPPGSPALQQAADYLKAEIRKLGLTPNEQVWEETHQPYGKPRTVTLRNVWTSIPAKTPGAPILLLAAHFDTKLTEGHPDPKHNFRFVGAMDATGPCGLLLELARVLKTRDNVPEIWFLWVDGEECLEFDWAKDNKMSLLGSQYFAKTMAADKTLFPKGLSDRMKVMILLDLLGDKNIKIDKDTHSNGALLDIFAQAAEQMGMRDRLYRWESPMVDDHVPFRNFGVAVIDLIDFRWRSPTDWQNRDQLPGPKPADGEFVAWWHTDQDTLDKMSAEALGFVGNLVWHALDPIERKFYGKP